MERLLPCFTILDAETGIPTWLLSMCAGQFIPFLLKSRVTTRTMRRFYMTVVLFHIRSSIESRTSSPGS
ncbi:hypothetical protein MPC4_140048 [Methylocella tundrae]|uniref:Uncharacterized protein n=1 Tax=Methylocella tundrae TaxID=227605 RepID=A0A8B6M433_METTU|nr:hypothetical protein MPC4_140048 [Methylocella tundrae]